MLNLLIIAGASLLMGTFLCFVCSLVVNPLIEAQTQQLKARKEAGEPIDEESQDLKGEVKLLSWLILTLVGVLFTLLGVLATFVGLVWSLVEAVNAWEFGTASQFTAGFALEMVVAYACMRFVDNYLDNVNSAMEIISNEA